MDKQNGEGRRPSPSRDERAQQARMTREQNLGKGAPRTPRGEQSAEEAQRKANAAARRRAIEKRKKERARRKRNRIIFRFVAMAGLLAVILLIAAGVSKLVKKDSSTESTKTAKNEAVESSQETPETTDESAEAPDGTDGTTEESTAEAASEPEPEPFQLTISTVGDITIGKDINFPYESSTNAYYDMYGSSYFMQNVKDIFAQDDLTIGNFEGTLTESENRRQDRQFCFKAPAEYANIVKDGNIEVVDTANNHSHDYGEDGYADTIANLDAAGIVNVGYEKYAVVEVKDGHKIGVVAPYVLIEYLDCAPKMIENIQNCRNEGADVVVVVFHWGDELATTPDYYQTTLGRMAIDNGADLVVGHHSHIIQGIEKYKGKYICYSLANFCFGGNTHPTDPDSFIFQQTFTVTGDGVVLDDNINIIPILVSSSVAINNYQPTPLTGADAERVLDKIVERTALVDTVEPQDDSYITTHIKNRNSA